MVQTAFKFKINISEYRIKINKYQLKKAIPKKFTQLTFSSDKIAYQLSKKSLNVSEKNSKRVDKTDFFIKRTDTENLIFNQENNPFKHNETSIGEKDIENIKNIKINAFKTDRKITRNHSMYV
jgi:hypothetical protein